jgi:hypothetical protein
MDRVVSVSWGGGGGETPVDFGIENCSSIYNAKRIPSITL